jgi:hypothetical protein
MVCGTTGPSGGARQHRDGVSRLLKRSFMRLGMVIIVSTAVVLPYASSAHASGEYNWYNSTSTGGCWATSGGSGGSSAAQCDSPGANWLGQNYNSSTNRGAHYVGGGAGGDVMYTKSSGDYCNSYSAAGWNTVPFNTYLSSYYWGAASSTFNGSYCYADGSAWGTNVSDTSTSTNRTIYAAGAQHFASVQGVAAYPWSSSKFGSSPMLYTLGKLGVFANTSKQAWGYLCADVQDTGGSGQVLELCGEEWDWGSKQTLPVQTAGCSSPGYGDPNMPAFGAINQKFGKDLNGGIPASSQIFTTRGGSYPVQTAQTFARTTPFTFSMQVSTTQLNNAIRMVNAQCKSTAGMTSFSTNVSQYRLLGVEDGVEQGLCQPTVQTCPPAGTYDVNAAESGLYFSTLY